MGASVTQADDYCFECDDTLADDHSFAVRLSNLPFVTQYVRLGDPPLRFGLGGCIGDAGDNLFVRTLSDGGIPYLAVLMSFFVGITFYRNADAGICGPGAC